MFCLPDEPDNTPIETANSKCLTGAEKMASGARITERKYRHFWHANQGDPVAGDLVPLAMIEVKIGVRTLSGVRKDLDKIITTMGMMKARYASNLVGVSVFQIHISGSKKLYEVEHFVEPLKRILTKLQADLNTYGQNHSDVKLSMHALQQDREGLVARETEMDGDGVTPIAGRDGHATCYFAILVRSTRPVPPHGTIAQLKAAGDE
jgi:hypothetical protein